MECADIVLCEDMQLFEEHLVEYVMKGDLESLSFQFDDHMISIDKTCFRNGSNQFWISFKVLKPEVQEWKNNPFSRESCISTMDPAQVFQVLSHMYTRCHWQENPIYRQLCF